MGNENKKYIEKAIKKAVHKIALNIYGRFTIYCIAKAGKVYAETFKN